MNNEQNPGGERPQGEAGPSGAEGRTGRRAAPDGAALHPLIDLSRDPNPGVANHAKPDED
ncbi:hypothetical protein [Amycolatopsis nigrescens]|uniref:hypothetical protein n=1 Tax=Amycolatopsis nigrescens TaxID=381445 RepID=UPI00037BCBB0|nr:hypothetical protein [Amycolatopsis nigrescens]